MNNQPRSHRSRCPAFDRIIERRGTHATKWDMTAKLSGITADRRDPDVGGGYGFRRACGGDRGPDGQNRRARRARLLRLQRELGRGARPIGWRAGMALSIKPEWVSPTPGIVSGLGLILQALSVPGDEVVVFPAGLSCVSQDHPRQRPADPRRATGAAAGPLRDGPRGARRDADAAHQSGVFLQPA